MGNLVIQAPTRAQTLAMADGLMARGEHALAAQLYASAGRDVPRQEWIAPMVRGGLASHAGPRTPHLLSALNALESVASDAFVGDGLATWHKTLPFVEDDKFLRLASKHAGLTPLANWHWNLHVALWAAREASTVDGDFVELGVFKGHTTAFLAEYLDFGHWPRRWWLYDTFAGIPDDQVDAGRQEMNERTYGDSYSYADVAARFASYANVEVIQGRVPEILNAGAPERVALLHVDLNNATAEVAALDLLWDRLAPGGIILLDDYLWRASRAQYEAEAAWFQARGLHVLSLPTGQAIVRKS